MQLNSSKAFRTLRQIQYIELINNKINGLLPPGGFVSPSVRFASLLFD